VLHYNENLSKAAPETKSASLSASSPVRPNKKACVSQLDLHRKMAATVQVLCVIPFVFIFYSFFYLEKGRSIALLKQLQQKTQT